MAATDLPQKNIVIIGGGIIGCSTAYYLTRHPSFDPSRHNVTIIEASEIAGGASGKAGGLIARWAFPSDIVPLSYRLHEELAKEHGGKERWGYREVNCGQLLAEVENKKAVKGAPEALSLGKRSEKALSSLKAAGIPDDLDWFEPEALKGYEDMGGPGMTAQVHPYLFTTSMAKLAEEKGASVILGSVKDIDWSSDGVKGVTYTDKSTGKSETLDATDVIVSAGPWSRMVFRPAPIEALRAHSVVIRPTRPVSAYTLFTNIAMGGQPGSRSTGKREKVVSPEIYARPDDTVYACGEGDRIVPLPDTTADVEVDQSRCQDIIDAIAAVSSELREGEEVARQACYLPNVASGGGPLIGKTPVNGIYLAAGHTCWGIQNAPGTGKLMSEFVFDGEAKSAKIGSLDPAKFMKVPKQNQ